MVKYLKFNAINFIPHSTVNLAKKTIQPRFWTQFSSKLDSHGHKKVIDVSKNTVVGFTLIVVFKTHAEHIEENAYHNEYIELLVRS